MRRQIQNMNAVCLNKKYFITELTSVAVTIFMLQTAIAIACLLQLCGKITILKAHMCNVANRERNYFCK